MAASTTYAFISVLLFAVVAADDLKDLKIRFGILDAYHDIPLTKEGLIADDYSLMVHDEDLNVDFYAYKQDPRISIGVDSYGNIAGVRVSFIKSDLTLKAHETGIPYNYSLAEKPMYKSATYFGIEVFYNTVLFTSPETLLAGGRETTNGIVAEEVYVRVNGVWSILPKNECNATAANYVKEACFPGMGLHYFYRSKACADIQGVFGLYENGQLIGMGFTTFGSHTDGPDRTWLEDLDQLAIRIILPTRPTCLVDWTGYYGVSSVHMFFKSTPQLTLCLDGETQC